MPRLQRPLWRAFDTLRSAVRHARRGGLAVLQGRVLGAIERPLLIEWAAIALEGPGWRENPALQVVELRIPRGWVKRVGEWLDRDSVFPGATATLSYDCMECAACCLDNTVRLTAVDRARLRAAGLTADAARRRLPLLRTPEKPCAHLDGFLCGIYPHRPEACREFPPGTEQCLFSREETFGAPFPPGR